MRLVDGDELKTAFPASENSTPVLIASVRATINHMPTIEQPEIIRCRECKYNDMPPTAGNAGCTLLYGMTNQNGFCSLAERREDKA